MKTFLIVDDTPSKLNFLTEIVEREWSGQVLTANTTENAMAIIDAFPVDAAFVDYYIPSQYGPAVISHLRDRWPKAKIALVSSVDDEANSAQARGAGADTVICAAPRGPAVKETLVTLLRAWKTEK